MATRTILGTLRHIVPVPLLVAGAASALPDPAGAAQPAGHPPIYAFSDSRTLPTAATLLAKLPSARGQLCAAGGPEPLASLTLDQALTTIDAYLRRAYGAKALAALDKGARAGNADQAEHVAAGAVLANAPGAALEAALLARQDAPTDPRPLINAAALLPDLGLADEALALLDAADRLSMPKGGAPLGIPLSAISLTNRGYALLGLRRWRQAEAPLREASRLSAYLPEADLNLGEAFLCAGDDAQSARYFIAGGRRDTFQPDAVENIGEPPAATDEVRADEIFDLSAGVERQLPDLKYPSTPEQAVAMYPVYHQIDFNTMLEVIKQRNALDIAIQARLPRNLNPATLQRTQDIMGAINGTTLVPGLHAPWTRMNTDNQEMVRLYNDFWGNKVMVWEGTQQPAQFKATCTSNLVAAHGQWLAAMRALDRDTRRFWQAYSKYTTGLAANLANPAYHALAVNQIAGMGENLYYSELFGPLWEWTFPEWGHRDFCTEGASAASPDLNWPAPQQTPPAAECGPGVAAPHNFVLTLPPPFDHVNLKANCESASVQVESPEPGIKGFISIGRDLRKGETTTVIGPKAGVSIPGTGISGGFETGIYVTTDSDGIKDWGLSANLTGSTPISPNGLAAFEANAPVTISFIGSIDYIPTAFGFSH